MDRPKFEFEINHLYNLEIIEPVRTGRSNLGEWYLYQVKDTTTNAEYALFAHKNLHEKIKNFPVGTVFEVAKLVSAYGKRNTAEYHVQVLTAVRTSVTVPGNNGNGNGHHPAVAPIAPSQPDSLPKPDQSVPVPQMNPQYFEVLRQCFEDGLRLQKELSGLIDVNRVAITLFIARSQGKFGGVT